MRNRRVAYYAIPALDAVFAWIVLLPLFQHITMDALPIGVVDEFWSYVIATPVALVLGTALAFVGRWVVCSDNGKATPLSYSIALIVPALYWLSYAMELKENIWTVLGFSILSFILQFAIIKQYYRQIEASNYFKTKKRNQEIRTTMNTHAQRLDADEERLFKELEHHTQTFASTFNNELGAASRNLAIARRKYINDYGEEPVIMMNQLIIYLVNLAFFRYPEIPFAMNNGRVEVMGSMNFPDVASCREIHQSDELGFIDYMLKKAGQGMPLTEALATGEKRGLLPDEPSPAELPVDGSADSATVSHEEEPQADEFKIW